MFLHKITLMLNINQIIKNAQLPPSTSTTRDLPKIIPYYKESMDLLNNHLKSQLDACTFNLILNYFNMPNYDVNHSTDQNLVFLQQMRNIYLENKMNLYVDDVLTMFDEVKKLREDEHNIDVMEIRLVKMKQKMMERRLNNANRNDYGEADVYKQFTGLINDIKNGEENLVNVNNGIKYFNFIKETPECKLIIENQEYLRKIGDLECSIEKSIVLNLFEKECVYLGTLADILEVERLALLKIIISMANDGILFFDRVNDTIALI